MEITIRGQKANLIGKQPNIKDEAPAARVYEMSGEQCVVGMIAPKAQMFIVVPSLKTEVCSYGAKKFDELLSQTKNLISYIVTADSVENVNSFLDGYCLKNIKVLLDKEHDFGKKYGVLIGDGALKDKLARAVFIADENGLITYKEIVSEIVDEINYDACMSALAKTLEPKPHDPHHSDENWMRH
ncbi:MAG: redoxin domain-containing protein [Campylobacteraceae bacterium]|jgi:thiol peroxidase|nr:redoxin domain-containing protein [Campylobacteraceae bacterium]